MRDLLWITPREAIAVALATMGMYVAMVVVVRILGQRILSTMSSFDLAAIIAFGAVIGRAALGETPRLAGGLVALATLLIMQALAGMIRMRPWGAALITTRPVLLMAGGTILDDQLRRCHIHRAELAARLRLAGVRHPEEVAAVVFEASGGISVLRRGEPIDARLLDGVVGRELLPPDVISE